MTRVRRGENEEDAVIYSQGFFLGCVGYNVYTSIKFILLEVLFPALVAPTLCPRVLPVD